MGHHRYLEWRRQFLLDRRPSDGTIGMRDALSVLIWIEIYKRVCDITNVFNEFNIRHRRLNAYDVKWKKSIKVFDCRIRKTCYFITVWM